MKVLITLSHCLDLPILYVLPLRNAETVFIICLFALLHTTQWVSITHFLNPVSFLTSYFHHWGLSRFYLLDSFSLNAAVTITQLTMASSLANDAPPLLHSPPLSLNPSPFLSSLPPYWPSSLHPPGWTPLSGAGPGCQALSCECGCCDFLWAIRWAAAN